RTGLLFPNPPVNDRSATRSPPAHGVATPNSQHPPQTRTALPLVPARQTPIRCHAGPPPRTTGSCSIPPLKRTKDTDRHRARVDDNNSRYRRHPVAIERTTFVRAWTLTTGP